MNKLNTRRIKLENKQKRKKVYNLLITLFASFLAVLVFSGYCQFGIHAKNLEKNEATANIQVPQFPKSEIHRLDLYQERMDSLRIQLVKEVDSYMRKHYPNTKLSADYIVDICIDQNFDIPLLLSQAQQESGFGKRMKGNSVFGVISRQYTNVDNAVKDYVAIMKKSYVKTRTPEECIASGFYVEGSRKYKYAGNPAYAQTIGKIRSNIIRTTSIQNLYNSIKEIQTKMYEHNRISDIQKGSVV